jgi:hypothetical protein
MGPVRAAVRAFDRFASRRAASVAFVGALAFACCALVAAVKGIPLPEAHDEQAYLLGADTFAHGRMTNPTVPCWRSLEQFHVLLQPTFAPKYPPAQAAFLALGEVLWRPILGVWIGVALACASLCWMLQRWVAPRWALLASSLCAVRLAFGEEVDFYGKYAYWSRSYWGGAVAMLGGCLLLGSVRRIAKRPRPMDGVRAGLGVALLATTRPFEGGLLCAVVGAFAIGWLVVSKRRPALRELTVRALAPAAVVLAASGAVIGYYDARVTGSAVVTPYQLHQEQYETWPFNPLAKPKKVAYDHEVFRAFYDDFDGSLFKEQSRLGGRVNATRRRLLAVVDFFLGRWTALAVVALAAWGARNRWLRFAAVGLGALLATTMLLPTSPHYMAPVACAVWLLVAHALRRLVHLRIGTFRGSAWLLAPALAYTVVLLPAKRLATPTPPSFQRWAERRELVRAQLEAEPGKHVVLVHYGPTHVLHVDWVFNGADLDGAKVIWARDDARYNGELVDYYAGRRFWCIDGDSDPPDLHECRPTVAERAALRSDLK